MTGNPFVLPTTEYKRDIDFLKHYVEQSAGYLMRVKGISREDAEAFVKQTVGKGGVREFKDRPIAHTYRDPKTEDRAVVRGTMYGYIQDAIRNRDIISPTLTRYTHPEILEAPLVKSIDQNVEKRNINKRLMFEAGTRGDINLKISKNLEQTNNKLSNNAVSGAHLSPGNPLFNKTAHSSLASTCRVTSGYGNANNEKIVSGNRHYYNYKIVMNNIISIVENTDYPLLESVMTKYDLTYPTTSDVLAMIQECCRFYWTGPKAFALIEELVLKLNRLELAAFMYTGDLYHIKKLNDGFVRTFIGELIEVPTDPHPNAKEIIKAADDDYISLANQLNNDEMKDVGLRDLEGTDLYGRVASTIDNVQRVLTKYADFIKAFMVTNNVPASLAMFPTSVRKSAVTSDTDSTIFTVQDWVFWYNGSYVMDLAGIRVMAAIVFIASQSITHTLAIMSANIGVETKRLHQIAMKNEYRFDVFVPTNQAKHYYAGIGCREGNVFGELLQEIKGVHLISSNVLKEVMALASKKMAQITETVRNGGLISMTDELQSLREFEELVVETIRMGKGDYFRLNQIKSADSYGQGPDRSPYAHYTLWRDVFAPDYGACEEPPYAALKINALLNSPARFRAWLDGLSNQALAQRFRDWLEANNKTHVATFYLPKAVVDERGIPDEIFSIIDKRRIILDNAKVFYMVYETLSFYLVDDKINRLMLDY